MKGKFLKYYIAGGGVLLAALVPLGAQEVAGQKVEVFTEGEKFPSLNQYRLHRRLQESSQAITVNGLTAEPPDETVEPMFSDPSSAPDPHGMETGAYIQNFLDSTLKNFSDEELKLILHELRKRRSDLFEDGGRDYSLEMKEMLNSRREQSREDMRLELDPSKVKTIIFTDDGMSSKSIILGDPNEKKKPASGQDPVEPL